MVRAVPHPPCQVIITPKAGKGSGMVAKAKELAEKHGWLPGAYKSRRFASAASSPPFHGNPSTIHANRMLGSQAGPISWHAEVPVPAVRERGKR